MSVTRRFFLGRSASAGVVLATVAAPVVAEDVQKEHPELLVAAAKLPGLIAKRDATMAARREARARYEAIAPKLPACLVYKRDANRKEQWLTEQELDCEDNLVWPKTPDGKPLPTRRLYSSHAIPNSIELISGGERGRELMKMPVMPPVRPPAMSRPWEGGTRWWKACAGWPAMSAASSRVRSPVSLSRFR